MFRRHSLHTNTPIMTDPAQRNFYQEAKKFQSLYLSESKRVDRWSRVRHIAGAFTLIMIIAFIGLYAYLVFHNGYVNPTLTAWTVDPAGLAKSILVPVVMITTLGACWYIVMKRGHLFARREAQFATTRDASLTTLYQQIKQLYQLETTQGIRLALTYDQITAPDGYLDSQAPIIWLNVDPRKNTVAAKYNQAAQARAQLKRDLTFHLTADGKISLGNTEELDVFLRQMAVQKHLALKITAVDDPWYPRKIEFETVANHASYTVGVVNHEIFVTGAMSEPQA